MMVSIICFECGIGSDVRYPADVDSNLFAQVQCPKGHKQVDGLKSFLHEALFHSAIQSFVAGYYSESVLSFNASLERAYEHFVRVSLLQEGLPPDQTDIYWKELSKQSERQYGAFCTQYYKVNAVPWGMNTKIVAFRNQVVHQGLIATRDEVAEYAEHVTKCHLKILKALKSKLSESLQALAIIKDRREHDTREKFRAQGIGYVIYQPMEHIDIEVYVDEELTFAEIVKRYSDWRTRSTAPTSATLP